MIGVVVAAHGNLAESLVRTAEGIVGPFERLRVVNLMPGEGLEAGQNKIGQAAREVDDGEGVLLLADLFGGTPSNCCLSLLEKGKLEVVTGVNLPMLLKLHGVRGHELRAAAEDLVRYGQRNVTLASALLRSRCQPAGT